MKASPLIPCALFLFAVWRNVKRSVTVSPSWSTEHSNVSVVSNISRTGQLSSACVFKTQRSYSRFHLILFHCLPTRSLQAHSRRYFAPVGGNYSSQSGGPANHKMWHSRTMSQKKLRTIAPIDMIFYARIVQQCQGPPLR